MDQDALLRLLARFQSERVQYVLVGGQAVRLNGFVRSTEDQDRAQGQDRIDREALIRLKQQL
jgi:hypothetical protein